MLTDKDVVVDARLAEGVEEVLVVEGPDAARVDVDDVTAIHTDLFPHQNQLPYPSK